MLLGLLGVIVVLLLFAAVHDARARRRGTYREAAHWQQMSARRRDAARDARAKRSPRR